jgi:tetratricopeptide (TPR) repeat protein
VRRIRFGDTPAAYTAGTELLRKGDFENAIKAFKEARTDPSVRSWWASVWCQRFIAEAYVGWAKQKKDRGKAAEAVKVVGAVTTEFADNFFKPDLQSILVEAYIHAGEPAKGIDVADALEKEVATWKDKTWYVRAKALGAQAMVAAKRYPEAISKLDTLVTFASNNKLPDWATEAQILKGNVILMQGNKDKALRAFKDLVGRIDKSWSNRAAASAYVGLGRVLLDHFKKPDEAREKLLTARVVYAGTDKKDMEVMAEAAFFLGRASEALAESEGPSTRLAAKKYYEEVVNSYASSSWVNKARERLKKLN